MRVVVDMEMVVVEDYGTEYVVSVKALQKKPVVHTGETQTLINIRMDFVEYGKKLTPSRMYLPKRQFSEQEAIDIARRLNKRWVKEKERLEELKELMI